MLEIIQRLSEIDPKRGLFFHEDFSEPPALIPASARNPRLSARVTHGFRALAGMVVAATGGKAVG